MEIKNTEFKTEDQKKQDETIRKIVLSHCVACHQQLDLLQLRLINFDDLIKGVIDTIKTTKNLLDQQEIIKDDKPKLKKV
jgi:mono/diheme cytochrome c family protein